MKYFEITGTIDVLLDIIWMSIPYSMFVPTDMSKAGLFILTLEEKWSTNCFYHRSGRPTLSADLV